MRLTDASVAIRPRTAWEALDLGTLLARHHARVLMASWALLTLPLLALLSLVFWQHPSWALLLFWWLKPAYERLPLYILSRAMFGDTPSVRQALRALPRLLKPQLLASLTWRRLSPTRSFDLPVLQLEGLAGAARSQRLVVLGQRDGSAATWLTVVGVHLESALTLGLLALLYLMIPQQLQIDLNWKQLIAPDNGEGLWLDHLSNFLYALVLVLWEPIYVACGFSLYLNRRTALEGWDIELAFRRLRQRLGGIAYALLLGAGLLLMPAGQPLQAAEGRNCPVPRMDSFGPNAERLVNQELTSEAAHQAITGLLDQPPFTHRETKTLWRLGDAPADKPEEEADPDAWLDWFRALGKLLRFWESLDMLALIFEVLLWTALFLLLGTLAWHYRDWLRTFAGRLGLPQRRRHEAPLQLFGLELAPESLPEDVAGTVEALWDSQPREALGLLYRALLSRLLHEKRLPLKNSHTEGEVLQLVEALQQEPLSRFSRILTQHWQNLAYGHRLPPARLKPALCEAWRQLFEQKVTA